MSGGEGAPAASTGRFAGLSADRDNNDRYGDRGGHGDRGYRGRDDRGGFNNRDRFDKPRGGDNDESGGAWRGGGGRGGGGDNWRGGGRDNWRGGGDADRPLEDGRSRPRLQLKSKGAGPADSSSANNKAPEEASGTTETKRIRQPETMNSRAAALGGAPDLSPRLDGGRGQGRREPRNEGPPPVRNARFERMAEEEREKQRVQREERGPPPMANSRFAAAAEADRSANSDDRGSPSYENQGPPPVANSRFAVAAGRSRGDYNDRGPPPVANSRFAAAAEADRSRNDFGDRERGPPPVANSRFAAAAEADRSSYNDRERGSSYNDRDRGSSYNDRERGPSYNDRGPPPVANSRFAAAAEADRSHRSEDRPRDNDRPRYDDRDRPRFNDRGPPPVANSRFAMAANFNENDNREYEERRRDRYGSRDRFDGTRSRFDPRYVEEPEPEVDNSRMEELLQQSKKKEQERVLEPKAKEHEANMFQFPAKALAKEEEDFLSYRKKEKEDKPAAVEPLEAEKPKEEAVSITAVSADTTEELMKEFVHGGRLGDDLKAWCDEKRLVLPTVEKLLGYFLVEHEKLNPDPDCAWAAPEQYGAALVSIVEEDVFKQMQVLWAIQEYCDGLGFPSFNDESVVQSMFRSMYKYDLAEGDAFDAWKEDQSETHEKGKMTAIMQTVDWFTWLEEDDDYDEEEEY